jgi:superfamily II DNA or RNA helicase
MTMMTTTTTSSFTLPERSKEFSTTLFHDLQNLDPHREIVGIEAPTGVGKTTLLVNMFRERSRTLMIMPTQFACQQWLAQKKPTDKMMIMNASKAVDYFIRHQGLHHLRTIILDEAHVDSREYYAIRKIMRMAKRRHHHKYY